MTREIAEVVAQHLLDVSENIRRHGVVQTVAAEVQPLTAPLERARVAADHVLLFNERDRRLSGAAQLIGGTAASWTAAEHRDVRKPAQNNSVRVLSTCWRGAKSRRGEDCSMSRVRG